MERCSNTRSTSTPQTENSCFEEAAVDKILQRSCVESDHHNEDIAPKFAQGDAEILCHAPEGAMDVEEWIIKQHLNAESQSMASDYLSTTYKREDMTTPIRPSPSQRGALHDDCDSGRHNDEGYPCSIGSEAHAELHAVTADVELAPPVPENGNEGFIAAFAVDNGENLIVLAGKRLKDPHNHKLLVVIFVVVASSIGGIAVGVLLFNQNNSTTPATVSPTFPVLFEQNLSSVLYSPHGPYNSTIGDTYASVGKSLTMIALLFDNGKIYFDILKRIDAKFTVISFAIERLSQEMDLSFISLYSDERWNGHTLDVLLNRIIEGRAWSYADITEGLVLQSMAGYPVVFHKYPNFTVNGGEIAGANIFYSNGVEHELTHVPSALVPWMYKTNYQMLLEVNEQRNGDLSDFVALVNVSDLKETLMLEDHDKPITAFVPTNAALAAINVSASASSSVSHALLLNHLIDGNLVLNSWQKTGIGTVVSDSELMVITKAGHPLTVEIVKGVMTLNGTAHIIQEDLFSFFGVLHVIDFPLAN